MMKEIRHKLKSLRVVFVCVGIVTLFGVSVYSAHKMLARPSLDKIAKKGYVTSSACIHTPTANMPTFNMHSTRRSIAPTHYAAPTVHTSSPTMPMTSTSMRLHQTSSATVHQVGGSGAAGGGTVYTTSSSRSSVKGISYSGISFGGNMLALSTSTSLAAPGATEANEVAQIASAPRKAKKDFPSTDPEPFPDPDSPVGDVAWPLMALLTIGWCVLIRRKRQQACK